LIATQAAAMTTTEATAHSAPTKKMKTYKEDQGRLARMAAFWSILLMWLFGCHFLHGQLLAFDSLARPLGDMRIPIVSIDLSVAFLVSATLFAGGALWIIRWQQQPKVADLLIETEAELRKVTWPTNEEVVNASLVVVICVVLLGGFLAGTDYVLARIMKFIVLGEG